MRGGSVKNKFSFIGKGRTIILEFKTKGVIGMLIIEQIYESSDIKSDFVRCPSCKKGRLCDKPAGERATVIALKPDHVGRTSSKIILKCPKCGQKFMIHLPKGYIYDYVSYIVQPPDTLDQSSIASRKRACIHLKR